MLDLCFAVGEIACRPIVEDQLQAASLPACAAAPVRARPHRSTEVDLCWIAKQLGLLHRPRRAVIEKVRALAVHAAFPLPKTPRFVKGIRVTGPQSIDALSIWDRDPVELWLDDDRPPAETAALAMVRRNSAREEMGKRALQLVASHG